MLKILYADCLGLSVSISLQFTLKMYVAAKNCEKFAPNLFWGVQGRPRSIMLKNLKSPSPVLVTICRMSVLICNRFHTRRANSGKITSF